MMGLAAAAAGALALILANVVGAGVMQVLAPIALEATNETAQVLGVVAAGLLAIACALAFLHGAAQALTMLARPARGKGSAHGPE